MAFSQVSRTASRCVVSSAVLACSTIAIADTETATETIDQWTVPRGQHRAADGYPPCGGPLDMSPLLGIAAGKITETLAEGAQIPPTSVFSVTGTTGARVLDRNVGDQRFATCGRLAVVIPADAHVIHVSFFATEGGAYQHDPKAECSVWRPDEPRTRQFTGLGPYLCSEGSAGFDDLTFVRQGGLLVIGCVFRDWGNDRDRLATMSVAWDNQDVE